MQTDEIFQKIFFLFFRCNFNGNEQNITNLKENNLVNKHL